MGSGEPLTDFSKVDVLASRHKSVNFGVLKGNKPDGEGLDFGEPLAVAVDRLRFGFGI